MLDPIGGFRRIQDFFISYIETSFRIADPFVAASRRELLNSSGEFAAEPYIEPVLRYESSDKTLEDLADMENGPLKSLSQEGRKAFVELALSGLFDSKSGDASWRRRSVHAPYIHQVKMLERGIRAGRPGIVTSGTGSGKTESFMLPILAALSNEAIGWPAPRDSYLQNRWWHNAEANWVSRRKGEKRPAAIRALVLYPMNALVEDQMARLRKTLDSDEARQTMEHRFAGNRIFFGQYTSATPVTGYASHPRLSGDRTEKSRRARNLEKLRKALNRIDCDQQAARAFDKEKEKSSEKTRYIFPSTDGGEMVTRWDMQAAPPDVLVTNASMLGAMLSREVEDAIFDMTREWLMSNEDAYFYLVFDELHLMRGSAGTETAMLIKSLIIRLGLDDPKHRYKLRLLASSASLPMEGADGEQSRKYLRDLFAPFGTCRDPRDEGSDSPEFWRNCVVEGTPFIPEPESKVDARPFAALMRMALTGQGDVVRRVKMTDEFERALVNAFQALGVKERNIRQGVKLAAETAAALLTHACIEKKGDKPRATSPKHIIDKIFLAESLEGEKESELALRGLMLLRALPDSVLDCDKPDAATPAFRVHTFVRNIEGFFASVSPGERKAKFADFC
ncbi:DEAD/DEAH box helicase, partial [Salmonella enterica subsp. enterica]|nr:DEAD/DEAH box helicase [Salmonella enterica subsp. enterica]